MPRKFKIVLPACLLAVLMASLVGLFEAKKSHLTSVRRYEARMESYMHRHYSPFLNCSDEQKQSIKELFSQALCSYTNGTVGQLLVVLPALTGRVERLGRDTYRPLAADFQEAFNQGCLYSPIEKEFPAVGPFAHYLDLNLEAVCFMAELELCRIGNEVGASGLEAWALNRLYRYREHYLRLEDPGFVRCVELRIADWEGRIESEQGFSLRAARRSFALSQARRDEVGDLTPKQVVDSARIHAQGLINVGYTPRWLEREFPRAQLETTLAE